MATRLSVAALGLLLILALSGCGSDDKKATVEGAWEQYNSVQQILKSAYAAMHDVDSVHVLAQTESAAGETSLDLSLRRNGDCLGRAKLASWRAVADLVVLDGTAYVRGGQKFWRDNPAGTTYVDQWVSTEAPEIVATCNFSQVEDRFRVTIDDRVSTKRGTAEIGRTRTVRIGAPKPGGSVSMFVAVTEPHRVLRLELHSTDVDGFTEYTAFDEPFDVVAPTESTMLGG